MTIKEAEEIIAKTNSPHLKRDMYKFIKRQRAKEGLYGKAKKCRVGLLRSENNK